MNEWITCKLMCYRGIKLTSALMYRRNCEGRR